MDFIKNLLEETMYEHYLKEQPQLVSDIKKLLIAGQPKSKIKKFVRSCAKDYPMTTATVSNMIDYVNKQIKN